MATTWISVPLTVEEKEALHTLAEMEFRNSRLQAALIIRAELERQGLLQQEVKTNTQDVKDAEQ